MSTQVFGVPAHKLSLFAAGQTFFRQLKKVK